MEAVLTCGVRFMDVVDPDYALAFLRLLQMYMTRFSTGSYNYWPFFNHEGCEGTKVR